MTDPVATSPQSFGAIPDLNQVASSLARQTRSAEAMADSGLDDKGVKVPLIDAVAVGLKHAKVFMYADTNHHNPLVTKPTSSRPFLENLRDNGVSDIKIEVGKEHQPLIDDHKKGILSQEQFEGRIQNETNLKGNDIGDTTRAIGRTAEFTRDNQMGFTFSDPGNGFRAGETDRDRFRDSELAADVNSAKGKVFLQYGHGHLSSVEERAQIQGGLVKMDVYQNRQSYERARSNMATDNANGFKFNEAKPDMVYFQDSRSLYMTTATPAALRADIDKLAAEYAGPSAPAASTPAVKVKAQELVTP